jgi:hypothetical protein
MPLTKSLRPPDVSNGGRLVRSRHGFRTRSLPMTSLFLVCVFLVPFAAAAAGCGEPPVTRAQEEVVAERALQAALNGKKAEFVTLVAPSFLAEARAEMPDSDDETLGAVLIAGFLKDIPFSSLVNVSYEVAAAGDEAAVYVWGVFLKSDGQEIVIEEAGAVRIPLIRENGSWYLDLLDL